MSARRWWLRTSGVVGFALAAALMSGCSDAPAAVEGPGGRVAGSTTAGQNASGALSIGLVVPPNFQINTISYQLTKSGFSQAGNLNVAQSGVVSGVIGGVPAGTGYTLALTASDVGQRFTSCAGSSMVAVTAGSTTPVSVNIECRLPPVPPPPSVPVPISAVVLLAVALLATGATATRHSGRRARNRPSDAPPSRKDS